MDSKLTNKKKEILFAFTTKLGEHLWSLNSSGKYEHRYIGKNMCTNVKGKVSTDPLMQIEHRLG